MKSIVLAFALVASAAGAAFAQEHQHQHSNSATPLQESGQAAFAAIQEVVRRLGAAPDTDWSRVNIERRRQHLIDMDEVTLHAAIRAEPIPGGERYYVSGDGRTREAIRNMVVSHVRAMGDAEHWTMSVQDAPDGAVVTAMAKQPGDVARIHALGLIGMMSDGAHHQPHHLMLASGADPHMTH